MERRFPVARRRVRELRWLHRSGRVIVTGGALLALVSLLLGPDLRHWLVISLLVMVYGTVLALLASRRLKQIDRGECDVVLGSTLRVAQWPPISPNQLADIRIRHYWRHDPLRLNLKLRNWRPVDNSLSICLLGYEGGRDMPAAVDSWYRSGLSTSQSDA
jgi:hypothetical protein